MQTSEEEADEVRRWMEDRGMKFHTGPTHETDLTDDQIHRQCQMYIAAVRLADDFGCNAIGIQYQQGLKDLTPASDLVEGTLNNADRPPVRSRDGKRVLFDGQPVVHFNEVDECAGLDGLITYRVQRALGQPVESTLHDVRWGDIDRSGTVDDPSCTPSCTALPATSSWPNTRPTTSKSSTPLMRPPLIKRCTRRRRLRAGWDLG
jgi:hypothetical protein